MTDLYFIQTSSGDRKIWVVYENETEARKNLDIGDSFYKIAAEKIEFLGTLQATLVK